MLSNGNAAKMPSMNKDKIWKMGSGPFCFELYYLFLDNGGRRDRLSYIDEKYLNMICEYSIDRELSRQILLELRNRIFQHKGRESVLVNEIKGIFELLIGCVKYAKINLDIFKN